jgi:hypothetical protein
MHKIPEREALANISGISCIEGRLYSALHHAAGSPSFSKAEIFLFPG